METVYSLLDEPLIRTRSAHDGAAVPYSLPGLLTALVRDDVRDFPALRPHQRHPWHAFLVQLAAMALHRTGASEPLTTPEEWRESLSALTSAEADDSAWCLVTPHDQPAFMQPPVPGGDVTGWKDDQSTPDLLDILATSKNHDLKQERMRYAAPDDWIFALVTLQTAAPFPGKGNYGVARMNGGSSSRPGVGVQPPFGPGRRWYRDVRIALAERSRIVEQFGYRDHDGIGLLWLHCWDGESTFSFADFDPFFLEICRRVRLIRQGSRLKALRSTSKGPRIAKAEAQNRKGNTGDLWTPVEIVGAKSLGISASGFDYRRTAELLFGREYQRPPAQIPTSEDDVEGLMMSARAIAGGQSKTDGYHERHVPIPGRTRKLLIARRLDELAVIATARIEIIAAVRAVLWAALATLFDKGGEDDKFSDGATEKAAKFCRPFEQQEDSRFFYDMDPEVESDDPEEVRLRWSLGVASRAETVLEHAFSAGPRNAEHRYRARAAALNRFWSGLRNSRRLPQLAEYYRNLSHTREANGRNA